MVLGRIRSAGEPMNDFDRFSALMAIIGSVVVRSAYVRMPPHDMMQRRRSRIQ